MDIRKIFDALINAKDAKAVEKILKQLKNSSDLDLQEKAFGNRNNNEGPIEVSSDPGRSLVERITNSIDAVLELEHLKNKGFPKCKTPREASEAWLKVPQNKGLAGLTTKERQNLANSIIVRLEEGSGLPNSRTITILDKGLGIDPLDMEETILSLNEDNKITKHYLAGTYGQGGSSTLAFSQFTLIASRFYGANEISFTLVYHRELPAEDFKNGRYVFLTLKEKVFVVEAKSSDIEHGTIIKHFGYDLTKYKSPIGPNSLYGVLGKNLFDPVSSFWFENKVHGWNRVIKGARNALNGAVDKGDENKGTDLDHYVPLYPISIGEFGSIGLEYWALPRPKKKAGKTIKNPANAFVNSARPIILSHNGQNQDEWSAKLITKDANFPFLRNRVICNINCDHLTPSAKRKLLASTRESSKEGHLKELIINSLVENLKEDDELKRLNNEAKKESFRDEDQATKKEVKKQVARLLKIAGAAPVFIGGTDEGEEEENPPVIPPNPNPPKTIDLLDPPTYIKILWDENKPISFYPTQIRYIRIETDAPSKYHDHEFLDLSKTSFSLGEDLEVLATSPLKGGRMRLGVKCKGDSPYKSYGKISVKLKREGLWPLEDSRDYGIIKEPKTKPGKEKINVPDFKFIPVDGPSDENWQFLFEDEKILNDTKKVASMAIMDKGENQLIVYYSTYFPKFSSEYSRLHKSDPTKANFFKNRYELWTAIHALLMEHSEEEFEGFLEGFSDEPNQEEIISEMRRLERCRLAIIAVIIGSRETKLGDKLTLEE